MQSNALESKKDLIDRTHSFDSPVLSFNEWDLLEEVIVGTLDRVTVPVLTHEMKTFIRKEFWPFYLQYGGKPYPRELVEKGQRALNNLQQVLEDQGVRVVRPEPIALPQNQSFSTPYFSASGFFNADIRDVLLVVGDTIIEAPMAQRCRYFESFAYHKLVNHYFKQGARWIAAPKSPMSDQMFDWEYPESDMSYFRGDAPPDGCSVFEGRFITTESEICFDGADFTRFGRDIFAQRSHVTNDLGIEWVRRVLEPQYSVHKIEFRDPSPVHMDATWVPVGEGKILSCPDRTCTSPEIVQKFINAGWEIFYPPKGQAKADFHMSSSWLSMNVLMIDNQRVVVEQSETDTIAFFKKIGLIPITVDFKDHYLFGGGFHCATLDIKRKGTLKSYF